MTLGGLSREGKIPKFQMNIVEKISRVALRRDCGFHAFAGLVRRLICGTYSARFHRGASPRLFDGELGNGLGLPVVEHLEILLLKIAHGVSSSVARHDSYDYEFHVHLKGGGHVAGRHLGESISAA